MSPCIITTRIHESINTFRRQETIAPKQTPVFLCTISDSDAPYNQLLIFFKFPGCSPKSTKLNKQVWAQITLRYCWFDYNQLKAYFNLSSVLYTVLYTSFHVQKYGKLNCTNLLGNTFARKLEMTVRKTRNDFTRQFLTWQRQQNLFFGFRLNMKLSSIFLQQVFPICKNASVARSGFVQRRVLPTLIPSIWFHLYRRVTQMVTRHFHPGTCPQN